MKRAVLFEHECHPRRHSRGPLGSSLYIPSTPLNPSKAPRVPLSRLNLVVVMILCSSSISALLVPKFSPRCGFLFAVSLLSLRGSALVDFCRSHSRSRSRRRGAVDQIPERSQLHAGTTDAPGAHVGQLASGFGWAWQKIGDTNKTIYPPTNLHGSAKMHFPRGR